MAHRLLAQTPFRDLLPDSITTDAFVVAAAEAVDEELAALFELIPGIAVWDNLQNTTEPLLGTLAWQMHLDGSEGYEVAQTDAERQALIATAIEAHRCKGTRWALERIADILGMRLRIVEWWEKDPPGQPYTFRIECIEVTRPITENLYDNLLRLVLELKNTRSYLEGLTVYLTGRGVIRPCAAFLTGQSVVVYPWRKEGVRVSTPVPIPGAAMQSVNSITVYPQGGRVSCAVFPRASPESTFRSPNADYSITDALACINFGGIHG